MAILTRHRTKSKTASAPPVAPAPPAAPDPSATPDISEADSWTREQTLAYFLDEHDLDLSKENDKQLAIFIRCEERGGDVKSLFRSTRRLRQAMREVTPEEQALWDIQLRAEGRL